MFKRKMYDTLLDWKRVHNGKSALLIEGARRIGKSTVVREFVEKEYEDYIFLDFSVEPQAVKDNFLENLTDLDAFFRNLFLLKDKTLSPGKAVIVFDEVQLFPPARQAIKTLVKDGRFHYIEMGSLISLRKNVSSILIPSEEVHVRMHPMDFEEFQWARGIDVTMPAIRDAYESHKPLSAAVHRRIMKHFREYMAVGGMPEAVSAFVDGASYDEIDVVKQRILGLYKEDLHSCDELGYGVVTRLFESVPEQLVRHSTRFYAGGVQRGATSDYLEPGFNFLRESMMVNFCHDVAYPDVLLGLAAKQSSFKVYMGDTGLLLTQVANSSSEGKNAIYRGIVLDKLSSKLGCIMENMVAQMLVANGHELYYETFTADSRNGSERVYEIDFLMEHDRKLCPIEVKSSNYTAHRSLDVFTEKFDVKIHRKIVLWPKDFEIKDHVFYMPLYMASCL